MAIEIEKICRTCLGLSGPLLGIYDGNGSGRCIGDMLHDFTKSKPRREDKLPEKVCLSCISEINRCYSFKLKCENSFKTLRQLVPDALLDEANVIVSNAEVEQAHKGVQTIPEDKMCLATTCNQTKLDVEKTNRYVQTTPMCYVTCDRSTSPLIMEHCDTSRFNRVMSENALEIDGEERGSIQFIKDLRHARSVKRTRFEVETDIYKDAAEIGEHSDAIVLYSTMHEDSNGTKENEATYNQFSIFKSGNESEEKLTKSINSAGEPKQMKPETDEYWEEKVYAPHVSSVEDVVYNAADGEEPGSNNGVLVCENDSGKSEIVTKQNAVTTRSGSTAEIYKKPIIKEGLKWSHCSMTFVRAKWLAQHKLKRHGIIREDRTAVRKEKQSSTTTTTTKSESLSGHSENSDDSDNASLNITTTTTVNETKRAKLLHSCDTCGAGFALQRSLNYHLNQDLCNKVTHSCNICERVFISKETLKEHKSMHLQETKCTKCDMIFGSNDELSKHMVAMHMRYLRNQCPHCKKVFTTISAFKDHLRVHSGEKPFVCDICSKGFSQKTYLKQHIMRHSKERNFKCGECSMGFVTKAELCRHKRIHTGEHPYRCVECYATFTKSSSLVKHHKRMHTGELPFACDFCSKRFACSTTLEIHQRTHTAEKPYKCCFCKKGFAQNRECIIHQLKEKILLKNRTKAQMNRCRIKPMIR
ncbi:PREDICTED: zinc finger protein 251-like isoform X5 [Rhagoletis zephyria]|uniref:zinc finger protein 251-like isoform X5 n=1 Tax=Rhagoletis zephyria TaxID=28612 RepID=UPI0008119479|nr:PREDICTED: zinc finger protein 251-like isoform X5 [Rhagoletis zephyria]